MFAHERERERERETCRHALIEDSLDIMLPCCAFLVGMKKPVTEGLKFLDVRTSIC